MTRQAIFMADQHFPYINERMERITLDYVNNNSEDIAEIIFGGDSVDNPAMSSFPQRAEDDTLLQEEVDTFIAHVNKYHLLVPKAKIRVIYGNHDNTRLNRTKSFNRSLSGLRNIKFDRILRESIREQGFNFRITTGEKFRVFGTYFVHGDPRIDPYIKGGITGARRTAEMHPEQGNMVMGHTHKVSTIPRLKGDTSLYVVGMMADIDSLSEQYKAYHGYQNGFLVATELSRGKVQFDNIEVKRDQPLYMDGTVYD